MNYYINFYLQVWRLLPPILRKPKMINWLWVLTKPITNLHAIFNSWRIGTERKLKLTALTYNLETV
ncbi:MAG: hypothetical protein IPI59_15685 [Sphingobacteriales bacterium]|jgi:hypothetical protein|nr:hypothetical protein [Sphingobacteriales bacterium]MBK6888554.1 hypothetical protein [Sphingobacteriales bacterium]MBK7528938.1 hypothetical protein [Sphingobacteriales bacterium]MBL0247052.1 hypothetical protein [Sphingobacteriales bacterium]MDA0199966.1 hypothetical protein [Bacteroidota bacterium]